jgi:hypothetical protein
MTGHAQLCVVCSHPANFRCQQCKILSYCSTWCQIRHWNHHRTTCLECAETLSDVSDEIGGITLFCQSTHAASSRIEAPLFCSMKTETTSKLHELNQVYKGVADHEFARFD